MQQRKYKEEKAKHSKNEKETNDFSNKEIEAKGPQYF